MTLRRHTPILIALAVSLLSWSPFDAPGMSAALAQTETPDQQVSGSAESTGNTGEPNLEFLNSGDTPTSISQLKAMERRIQEVYEKVKPATVNIQVGMSQGTGVVVTRDGVVLTAAHVIGGPDRTATITFPDGRRVNARTLGVNRPADSGMLKIDEEGKWPYVGLGESESLNGGQWVVAVGHPGGIDMKRGLVVRVGRIIYQSDRILRTDCTLVGGDSGGPLVDMDGYLIGIHSRIGQDLNENIHVAIDMYSNEWDQLENGDIIGVPSRPWLGMDIVDETNEVESLSRGGPADEAGIQVGDRIVEIDGQPVKNKKDIQEIYGELQPNQKIKIVVKRPSDPSDQNREDDETLTLELNVGRR